MSDSLLFEELGRTQTVKDVAAAYRAILEGKRKFAVRMKHARQDQEKVQAEIQTFVDDLKQITGLPESSPLFVQIALMTIARRLARHKAAKQLAQEFTSSQEDDGFPAGW